MAFISTIKGSIYKHIQRNDGLVTPLYVNTNQHIEDFKILYKRGYELNAIAVVLKVMQLYDVMSSIDIEEIKEMLEE